MNSIIISKVSYVNKGEDSHYDAVYKEAKNMNNEASVFHITKNSPLLKLINISHGSGGQEFFGETRFDAQKVEMQSFYERMNKRFGG